MIKKYPIAWALFIFMSSAVAAQNISPDEYFQMARKAAFEGDNYPEAIRLSRLALQQSPGYTDIQIFLGRVYYWNKQTDSSLLMLKSALESNPAYEDAAVAITDIEYFSDHYPRALYYAETGLKFNPASMELLVRKVKCLTALNQYKKAWLLCDSLLKSDPANAGLRSLANRIKDHTAKNKVGISYDLTGFDEQFPDPWHLVSLDYSRQTKAGSFIARVNYGNRHTEDGVQFELDAYPKISRTFYAYMNIGYSADMPIFPKFRGGFSLYANLPHALEADAGFRYLNFDNDTWMYTLSVGKYYKNFWFNGRTYLTPSSTNISQSYTLTARYYPGGAENYLSFFIGHGISPDDRNLASQLNNPYKLLSKRIGGGYRFSVRKFNIFSFAASYENVEYMPKTTGNQVNISVGFQRRF